MTNIVQFPKPKAAPPAEPRVAAPRPAPVARPGWPRSVWLGLVGFVWLTTVLLWPVLRWIVVADVTFQGFRMLYYWDTPGAYAGWTFLMHFAALVALQVCVAAYRPKAGGGVLAAKRLDRRRAV